MANAIELALPLLGAVVTGCLLAAGYFGGLWWTVRRLPDARHPWAWYFGSLAVRLLFIMIGFFLLLTNFPWPYLAACLIGFLATRLALIRLLGPGSAPIAPREKALG